MDQIKKFLAVVKKQHFWILSGLAVLLGLIVCISSSNKAIEAYEKQKQKIAGINLGLDSLVASTEHPNIKWGDEVHKATDDLRQNVGEAWTTLYNDQCQRVYIWPEALGPAVKAAFRQPASKDDPRRMIDACERYQKFVKTEVRRMGAVVNADWPEKVEAEGRPRPGREPDAPEMAGPQKIYLVDWDKADRERLVYAYDWQDRPAPLDVRYAQEELWVMNAICEAIARTNEGAKLPDEALVREIHQMLIGYDAVSKFPLGEGEKRIVQLGKGPVAATPAVPTPTDPNQVAFEPKRPDRHKGTGDENDAGGRVPGMVGRGGIPAAGPTAAADAADPYAWLKEGRYVSPKGRALTAKDTPPVAQYNLMGFRLNLVVDELRWEKLLLELANSPLPLEVREVRINVADNTEDRRGGHEQHGADSSAEGGAVHNIRLELRGVAYLINPPDPQSLGLPPGEPSAGGQPAVGAAPGAPPPATPAAGAAPPVVPPPGTPAPGAGPIATPPSALGAAPPTGPGSTPPPAATK